MDIAFYDVTAPNNALDKLSTAELVASYSGPATIDVSDLNPTLILEEAGGGFGRTANWAYITDFGRFYFIKDCVQNVAQNIATYHLELDVLQTFESAVRNLEVVVERTTDNYDMYLKDPMIPVDCRKTVAYRPFSSTPFHDASIVMLVLGGDS